MSTDKQVVFHIGIHKTGTTSIQEFLGTQREKLRALNVDFYTGNHIPNNHVELHAAAMRLERTSPFKLDSALVVDKRFREDVRTRVQQYIRQSPCSRVVFSAEGLSYLRYEDEIIRLKEMVPHGCSIQIVIYLRDALGFLASYRKEMKKHVMPAVIEPDSFAYTAEDSWLVDFESRLDVFRNAFGRKNVTVRDYDQETHSRGSVIPSFLTVLGIESHFDSKDWESFFLNRTA